ncbi:MAG: Crp/Fnr family transcriptional regulator [Actinomycetota bacterium]
MGFTTAAPAPAASALPPLRPAPDSRSRDAGSRLWEALGGVAVRSRSRAEQALLRQDEPQRRIFLVESGVVELSCVAESGRECVLDLVLPGEAFGGLVGETPFAAIAREECQVLSAGPAEMQAARDARVATAVTEMAQQRALRLAERLREALVLDSAERVMAVVSDLADRRSTRTPEGRRVDVSITQEDLGRMTGCTRETVNRTLGPLLAERRLLRRGRRFVVPYSVPP